MRCRLQCSSAGGDSTCRRSLNRDVRARLATTPQLIVTPSQCPSRGMSSVTCLRHSLMYSFSLPLQAMIAKLSSKVLLDIFRYYLNASPRSWPRLVHICRKWRCIVFASQRVLRLRLYCTHRVPLWKTLDCWPASVPIVVEYGGSRGLDPPTPEDEDNIIAAVKQSDRIGSISLTVTNSLLEKLSAIKRPFPKLEDLIILTQDSPWLALPSSFGWGT